MQRKKYKCDPGKTQGLLQFTQTAFLEDIPSPGPTLGMLPTVLLSLSISNLVE